MGVYTYVIYILYGYIYVWVFNIYIFIYIHTHPIPAKVNHPSPEQWRLRCRDGAVHGLGGRSQAGWLRHRRWCCCFFGPSQALRDAAGCAQVWGPCTAPPLPFSSKIGEFHQCCSLHQPHGEAAGGREGVREMEGKQRGHKGQSSGRDLTLSRLSSKRRTS